MTALATLTSPFRLGSMTLRNRIVSTPRNTHFPVAGYITDDDIRYDSEKAQGGAGLLQCFGAMSAHPSSPYQDWGNLKNWDDSSLPGFERFSAEMHRHPRGRLRRRCRLVRRGAGNARRGSAPAHVRHAFERRALHPAAQRDWSTDQLGSCGVDVHIGADRWAAARHRVSGGASHRVPNGRLHP